MNWIFHLLNIHSDFANPYELDWEEFKRAAVETETKQIL